ncbi:MAG: SDR family NAD(P)-dependent oxidoreductase [Anaerolineae bacterium]|nr:SDR family NAD(P)-dependent oxidoreductase [Anaerolineae bacterium]
MRGWTAKDIPDQHGRVVIITGANSGVGYESAVALARKGAHVIMACRSRDKAERARQTILSAVPNASIEVMALDLGSLKSIRTFADACKATHSRLDILMNNAGIMTPPYGKTVDGFETQFGTNHLGHFALTGLLLPKLLETPKSRIVTVSSGAYLNGRINFDDLQSERDYKRFAAYGQSKLANILFMRELQRKLEAARADVISVASQPGYAVTNLQANQQMPPLEATFFTLLKWTMSQPADLGATYQLYAATVPNVHGGEFFEPKLMLRGKVVRRELNARGKDTVVAARLWQVSEQLTGVHYEALKASVPVVA